MLCRVYCMALLARSGGYLFIYIRAYTIIYAVDLEPLSSARCSFVCLVRLLVCFCFYRTAKPQKNDATKCVCLVVLFVCLFFCSLGCLLLLLPKLKRKTTQQDLVLFFYFVLFCLFCWLGFVVCSRFVVSVAFVVLVFVV